MTFKGEPDTVRNLTGVAGRDLDLSVVGLPGASGESFLLARPAAAEAQRPDPGETKVVGLAGSALSHRSSSVLVTFSPRR